ncbi:MAG: hypothetical protein ACFFG0_06175 [Candidatus Thorarchaeota archaeon]
MDVTCKHCRNKQEYHPRNPNKIPKYPHKKCTNCGKNIAIKRTKLINFNHSHKFPFLKFLRKNSHNMRIMKNLKILELLGQGFCAQEIAQKYSLSTSFLSRIIKSFKKRKLIEEIQSYPKRYKLSYSATLILAQGDLSQTRISEFISDKRILQETLPPVRVHSDRFKNRLYQKPSWLFRIQNKGITHGLVIKRVKMKNWDKFVILFNYQDFKGLDNIEVCNNVIIYNFKRNLGDQLVFSKEQLDQHISNLTENCKKARAFLQEKGFTIGQEEPARCQKPHYAINTEDPEHIGQLGRDFLITIKTPNESLIIDDSPDIDGEEEIDNIKKVKSYFDMPDKIEEIETNFLKMEDKVNRMTDIKELEGIKTEINEIKKGFMEMTNGIKEMKKAFLDMATEMKNLCHTIVEVVKEPKQITKIKKETESMYQ